MMDWLLLGDYFGVVVFAVSGVLAAVRRKMDVFGVFVIAFVTALGGGTLRDMALGIHPVSWMNDPVYLVLIALTVGIAMLWLRFGQPLNERLMLVSDALGLAVFTIIGVQVALDQAGVSVPVAILMGAITGAAGGVIRDIICNVVPLIFRREIYATASVLGGSMYCLLEFLAVSELVNTLVSMAVVLVIRVIAFEARWRLPAFAVGDRSAGL